MQNFMYSQSKLLPFVLSKFKICMTRLDAYQLHRSCNDSRLVINIFMFDSQLESEFDFRQTVNVSNDRFQ
jgi:hypothetical protein